MKNQDRLDTRKVITSEEGKKYFEVGKTDFRIKNGGIDILAANYIAQYNQNKKYPVKIITDAMNDPEDINNHFLFNTLYDIFDISYRTLQTTKEDTHTTRFYSNKPLVIGGHPFLVMEDYETLSFFLREENFDKKDKIRMFMDISKGLAKLHEHEITHNNVHPYHMIYTYDRFAIEHAQAMLSGVCEDLPEGFASPEIRTKKKLSESVSKYYQHKELLKANDIFQFGLSLNMALNPDNPIYKQITKKGNKGAILPSDEPSKILYEKIHSSIFRMELPQNIKDLQWRLLAPREEDIKGYPMGTLKYAPPRYTAIDHAIDDMRNYINK